MCDSPLFDNQSVNVIVLRTSAFDGLLTSGVSRGVVSGVVED